MINSTLNSVKYYVRFNGTPCLAIKVFKDGDKYHRFIAIINNSKTYKEVKITNSKGKTKTIHQLVSPKIAVTDYLNAYADSWVMSGFKSDLPQRFTLSAAKYIYNLLTYTYGINEATKSYIPLRYETNVKLFDWEFRMFHKP